MFLRDVGRVERGDEIEAVVDVAFLNAVFGFAGATAQRVIGVLHIFVDIVAEALDARQLALGVPRVNRACAGDLLLLAGEIAQQVIRERVGVVLGQPVRCRVAGCCSADCRRSRRRSSKHPRRGSPGSGGSACRTGNSSSHVAGELIDTSRRRDGSRSWW